MVLIYSASLTLNNLTTQLKKFLVKILLLLLLLLQQNVITDRSFLLCCDVHPKEIDYIIKKKKKSPVDLIQFIGYVWMEAELNASLQSICRKGAVFMHGQTFHSKINNMHLENK